MIVINMQERLKPEFSAVPVEALFEAMNHATAKTLAEKPDGFGLPDVLRNMDCSGELERMTAEHATGALKVYLALLFDPVAREYFKVMAGYANRKPQA